MTPWHNSSNSYALTVVSVLPPSSQSKLKSIVNTTNAPNLPVHYFPRSLSYSTFHTSSVHKSFPAPPMDMVTAPCYILFHSTSTSFHHIPLHSPSPFLFRSTFMSILLSPLSVLISTLLYWLDKILFYVLCLSSVTPWSLLSIPCHTKCSSYSCLYLPLFILTYVLHLLLLTSPTLRYSAFKWYKYLS